MQSIKIQLFNIVVLAILVMVACCIENNSDDTNSKMRYEEKTWGFICKDAEQSAGSDNNFSTEENLIVIEYTQKPKVQWNWSDISLKAGLEDGNFTIPLKLARYEGILNKGRAEIGTKLYYNVKDEKNNSMIKSESLLSIWVIGKDLQLKISDVYVR